MTIEISNSFNSEERTEKPRTQTILTITNHKTVIQARNGDETTYKEFKEDTIQESL